MSLDVPVLLDPRDYVDRDEQQQLVADMVAGASPVRVLVIADASGEGKSDLLARLRVNCDEGTPRALTMLADLRDLATAFGALERAQDDQLNHEAFDVCLPRFTDRYRTWATRAELRFDTGGRQTVLVDASHSSLSPGAHVVGQQVIAEPAGVDNRLAQRECVRAFLDDLRGWTGQPLVLLVDHLNKAAVGVRAWLERDLLRPCVRGELGDVRVVVATTPREAPRLTGFGDSVAVTRLARLHTDLEQLACLLQAHRLLAEPGDPAVELAADRLARGLSIGTVIEALAPLAGAHDGP